MNPTLISTPEEPLTWIDAKAQSRIDIDEEQALVEGYLRAARAHVSERLHRQLCTATYELRLDRFPLRDMIELPIAPCSPWRVSSTSTPRERLKPDGLPRRLLQRAHEDRLILLA